MKKRETNSARTPVHRDAGFELRFRQQCDIASGVAALLSASEHVEQVL